MPGREYRQRAEQADPGAGRAGLSRRAVQPGELVAAGRREHVPGPAGQFGDHRVVQAQVRCQLRVAGGQRGRVLLGDHRGRVRAAQQVVLGVLHDLLD